MTDKPKQGVEQFIPDKAKNQSPRDDGSSSVIREPSRDIDLVDEIEVEDDFSAPEELLKAQALANLLDTAVKIPFIGIKVGLDFLIGLIPGIGDTIMLLASMRIVYLAKKMNLPKELQTKILRTALIDYGLGFIPIVGDIIDLFFKANQRNVRTMEQWWVTENKDKIDALARRQVAQWHEEQAKKDGE